MSTAMDGGNDDMETPVPDALAELVRDGGSNKRRKGSVVMLFKTSKATPILKASNDIIFCKFQ